ncbi:hypothetical protein V2J09_006499 [Rumex salicifolius]
MNHGDKHIKAVEMKEECVQMLLASLVMKQDRPTLWAMKWAWRRANTAVDWFGTKSQICRHRTHDRATNHMSGRRDRFTGLVNIPSCNVGMPNGNSARATMRGTVIVVGKMPHRNVLFVPNLTCELISVTRLVDETDCVVVFSKNVCIIQDRSMKRLIGADDVVRREETPEVVPEGEIDEIVAPESSVLPIQETEPEPPREGRGCRLRFPLVRLQDFVAHSIQVQSEPKSPYPMNGYVGYERFLL